MKVTLPEFERAGVMVVGDVMLDRYWYGPTSRISPEAPVPVVKVDTIEERPVRRGKRGDEHSLAGRAFASGGPDRH